jgi:hypothetical protein
MHFNVQTNRVNTMQVQAAAISIEGKQFVVALVQMELVTNAGEGDMAINTMEGRFGGAPVVLMAQREDTSPVYYGDEDLVRALRDIPIDRMPWKEYSI